MENNDKMNKIHIFKTPKNKEVKKIDV